MIDVAVPQIVIMEAARQMLEHLDAARRKITSHVADLELHYERLRDAGVTGLYARWTNHVPHVLARDDVSAAVERRVEAMNGHVLPLPKTPHVDLVNRDLDRRKPFHETGKGYRDALAWLSIVERLKACPTGQQVIFVSANSNDYLVNGSPAPNLLDEIPKQVKDAGFRVVKELADLLALDDLESLLEAVYDSHGEDLPADDASLTWAFGGDEAREGSASEVLAFYASRLSGSTVSQGRESGYDGLAFEHFPFPDEAFEVQVDKVTSDGESARWRAYDVFADDSLLLEAEIAADIEFVAIMDAEYYYLGAPTGVEWIEDITASPRTSVASMLSVDAVRVAFQDRALLHFRAKANKSTMRVSHVDFDYAEPVPESGNAIAEA